MQDEGKLHYLLAHRRHRSAVRPIRPTITQNQKGLGYDVDGPW